jgi:acetyl/propionyl-CoA carboxylase alpha subunit
VSWRAEFVRGAGTVVVAARHVRADRWLVRIGDRSHEVTAARLPDGRVRFELDGAWFEADLAPLGRGVQVRVAGRTWLLAPVRARARGGEKASGTVEAPMTGTIQKVLRRQGETVAAGDVLLVLTAMKMEHKLTAAIGGLLAVLDAEPGRTVEAGTVLARIEPTP